MAPTPQLRMLGPTSIVLTAFARSSGHPPAEDHDQRQEAIYHGKLDTIHQAVITVVRQGSASALCIGTIVCP